MKVQKFLMFVAVVLIASAAQGQSLLNNSGFEDDLALVPNAGNTSTASPTDWTYDSAYYGYNVDQWLMNTSAVADVGNGDGGDVGVVFPSWNDDTGWAALLLTDTVVVIQPGTYTITAIGAIDEVDADGLSMELYWTDNLADPWAGSNAFMPNGDQFLDLGQIEPLAANTWRTHTFTSEILAGDPAVGNFLLPWIGRTGTFDGRVILGEYSITYVPEPVTLALLGLGGLALSRRRRRV